MLGALIIVFREVIEAGLIVGIVMAARRGVHRADLHWAAGDPAPPHLLGYDLADRAARRRHGGAVGAIPQQRRHAQCARAHDLGYVGNPVGRQPVRPPAAYLDRIYRAADRVAASGLYRHAVRDVPADAAGALFAAQADAGRRRIISSADCHPKGASAPTST